MGNKRDIVICPFLFWYLLYFYMKFVLKTLIFIFISGSILLPQQFNVDHISFEKNVSVLGSDLFEGRGTGTRGGELAANYIAKQFQKNGLLPFGNNSYFQDVPLHGSSVLDKSNLVIYSAYDTVYLKHSIDYLLSNTGEQTILPYPIEIVFAGYGIIAPEYDHNDYIEKDVTGKIVILLDGEPYSNNNDYFAGNEPTIYSYIDTKHRIAISRGAAGTIIIPDFTTKTEWNWEELVNDYSFEDINLLYSASDNFCILLNPNVAINILNIPETISFDGLNKKINNQNISLKFEGEFFEREFKSQNVIGIINPAQENIIDEYIIISAHYDHLGIGPEINSDAIYNGVLDNALGVAALIEIAKNINLNADLLKRPIIFIALTGEEHGLLGSTFYTDHPVVPLYKTIANINIDGVPYLDIFNSIVGVGANLSDLIDYLNATAQKMELSISKIPPEFYSYETFNRSDQIAFAKAGIPSILVLDAIDYISLSKEAALEKIIYYNQNIYHTPFDDLNIEINYEAAGKYVKLISLFAIELSNATEEISWKENSPYNFIRLQTKAEKR